MMTRDSEQGAAGPAADQEVAAVHQAALDGALLWPRTYDAYRRYAALQADPVGAAELRRTRLGVLLRHAMDRVPAHREHVDRLPRTADPVDLLTAFPPLSKAQIRDRFADHCDDDLVPSECRLVRTSGTTGIPFAFLADRDHAVHLAALNLALADRETPGSAFHRRVLELYDARHEGWFEFTSTARGFARVASAVLKDTDERALRAMLTRVREFRPDLVFGLPSQCVEFIDRVAELGLAMPPAPIAVHTTSETLTEHVRDRIAQGFGAPVRNTYAMREVGAIAAECAFGTYHVMDERLWVEVVDERGRPVADGREGEILVTNLISRAMPLIRYRTGDRGALVPRGGHGCPCGRASDALRLTAGRSDWALRLPNGSRVPVLTLTRLIRRFPVERYQIVRRRPELVEILVRELLPGDPRALDGLAEQLRTACHRRDRSVEVRLRAVGSHDFVSTGARKQVEYVDLTTG